MHFGKNVAMNKHFINFNELPEVVEKCLQNSLCLRRKRRKFCGVLQNKFSEIEEICVRLSHDSRHEKQACLQACKNHTGKRQKKILKKKFQTMDINLLGFEPRNNRKQTFFENSSSSFKFELVWQKVFLKVSKTFLKPQHRQNPA